MLVKVSVGIGFQRRDFNDKLGFVLRSAVEIDTTYTDDLRWAGIFLLRVKRAEHNGFSFRRLPVVLYSLPKGFQVGVCLTSSQLT